MANILGAMPLVGANLRKFGAFAVRQATLRSKANVQKRDLFYYLVSGAAQLLLVSAELVM